MSGNNGFKDALKQMKTLVNVNEKVTMDALEDAANYFVSKLEPALKKSNINKKHMADSLKVVIKKDKIIVIFKENAHYWYMVEKGHRTSKKRIRGTHTIKKTIDAQSKKLEEIMLNKIIKKMEG